MYRITRSPNLSSMIDEFKKRLKKRSYYFICNCNIHKITSLEVYRLQLLNAKKDVFFNFNNNSLSNCNICQNSLLQNKVQMYSISKYNFKRQQFI